MPHSLPRARTGRRGGLQRPNGLQEVGEFVVEVFPQLGWPAEALPRLHDAAEVFEPNRRRNGREVLGGGKVSRSLKDGQEERPVSSRAARGAFVPRDRALVTAEASEHVLMIVVGGREIRDVVAREDLLTEVVRRPQHVVERRAASGRASVLGGVTHVVEDGHQSGTGFAGRGRASEGPRGAANDGVEEADVGGLLGRGLYGVTEVLAKLPEEQGPLFLRPSWRVSATCRIRS